MGYKRIGIIGGVGPSATLLYYQQIIEGFRLREGGEQFAVSDPLDRALLLEACRSSTHDHVVITHGTDTMVESASYIAKASLQKTIVLTGAMVPYTFGTSSDGFFNLGSALAFVQCQPMGVYVVMNGRCFLWSEVGKNYNTGYFEVH